MKKNFYQFKYTPGKPVNQWGKVVLLDKHRDWSHLQEGVEYVIENPTIRELEKCTIITAGTFLRVDELPIRYVVSGGPYYSIDCISFDIYWYHEYQGVPAMDAGNFDIVRYSWDGYLSDEEGFEMLMEEQKEQIAHFRKYTKWLKDDHLVCLSRHRDISLGRAFKLVSEDVTLEPVQSQESGFKTVAVAQSRHRVYELVFMQGYAPAEPVTNQEVTEHLQTLTLEESGLPFSFRTVYKCPSFMVGYLTVNGQKVDGLVKRPGDDTGSYILVSMYMGLLELPPITLKSDSVRWIEQGGKICWVYTWNPHIVGIPQDQVFSEMPSSPVGWVKVLDVVSSSLRYVYDPHFEAPEYQSLVQKARERTVALEALRSTREHGRLTDIEEWFIKCGEFLSPQTPAEEDLRLTEGWKARPYIVHLDDDSETIYEVVVGENEHVVYTGKIEGTVIIPQDGSGVYLRAAKDSLFRDRVEIAQAIAGAIKINATKVEDQPWKACYNEQFKELCRELITEKRTLLQFNDQASSVIDAVSRDYSLCVMQLQDAQQRLSDMIASLGDTRYVDDQVNDIKTSLRSLGNVLSQGRTFSGDEHTNLVESIDRLMLVHKEKKENEDKGFVHSTGSTGGPSTMADLFSGIKLNQ